MPKASEAVRSVRGDAVRAQLLDRPRATDLLDVVRRLTMLQLDATAAVAPNADLVLWSRLGSAYSREDLEIAREQGVPPYVIFHDATLVAMVRARTPDRAALAEIPGVGASKLERYGARFLAAIAAAS